MTPLSPFRAGLDSNPVVIHSPFHLCCQSSSITGSVRAGILPLET